MTGDSVAGGRFCPRKVVLSPQGHSTAGGRICSNRESDNVSQTNTTRKNARQQHPPQTKLPSQHSSTLQIPNPTNHSRPFHPPDSKPPSQNRSALPIQESSPNNGAFTKTRRVIMYREGDNVSQTSTTRKNARQQHPPQTKPPSQSGQNRRKTGSPGQSGGRFGCGRADLLKPGG